MPKVAVSVTLDQDNLLWLRGLAAGKKRRSLSEALDEVVTAVRLGGRAAGAVKSIVGTIDIATDDPRLERADEYVRAAFTAAIGDSTPAAGRARSGGRIRTHRTGEGKGRRG